MWEKPSSKKREKYNREQEREKDLKKEIITPKKEKKETRQSPPLKVVCQVVRKAPMQKIIHDLWMMFLPFGRNKGKGTFEMHPLDGEGILMMNGIARTYSNVYVSILVMASSKSAKKKGRSNKEG